MEEETKKEFVKGSAFFPEQAGLIEQKEYLDHNIECDVLVIGGGINGVLASYYFAENNIDTVLIDKGRLGMRSTALATVLLEYQLDDHAEDLKGIMSEEDIALCYTVGKQALEKLDNLIEKIGNNCNYKPSPTLKFTNKKSNIKKMETEFDFRTKHGFETEFVTGITDEIKRRELFKNIEKKPIYKNLGFEFFAGLYSKTGGAEFNPYLFCKEVLKNSKTNILKVFENTEAKKVKSLSNGQIKIECEYGYSIVANKVVIATGYSTKFFTNKKLCKKHITFSLTTNVQNKFSWKNSTMLQDDDNPYHYIRFLPEGKIIVGGEDIPLKNKFVSEKEARKKYAKLFNYTKNLFPDLANSLKIEHAFCGEFSSTKNNMGVFGPSEENPNIYFCLGYGANGIINCLYATDILLDLYKGKQPKNMHLFTPTRKKLF